MVEKQVKTLGEMTEDERKKWRASCVDAYFNVLTRNMLRNGPPLNASKESEDGQG